jgi:hypothetical protein
MFWVLIENTKVIVGRDVLDAIFTSVGMAQSVHVATVNSERDHVMEDLSEHSGLRKYFSRFTSS